MCFNNSADLQKFDALKNPEVNEFRGKMKALCDEVVAARSKLTWSERVRSYKFVYFEIVAYLNAALFSLLLIISKERESAVLIFPNQVQYHYPARIAANPELASYITERLQDNQLLLSVQFDNSTVSVIFYKLFWIIFPKLQGSRVIIFLTFILSLATECTTVILPG